MNIAYLMEFPGVTTAQYDAVMEKLGITKNSDGAVCHVAGTNTSGLFVMDVWSSEEKAQAFYQGTLAPILKQMGVPAAQPKVIQVHNMMM